MTPSDQPSGPFGEPVERLIEAARAGSRDALGTLLQGFRGLLLAEARAQLPAELAGKVGASDLVQSTFLEAQQGFAEFRGTSEPEFRSWLCSILGNNVQNCIRAFRNTAKRDITREGSDREGQTVGG